MWSFNYGSCPTIMVVTYHLLRTTTYFNLRGRHIPDSFVVYVKRCGTKSLCLSFPFQVVRSWGINSAIGTKRQSKSQRSRKASFFCFNQEGRTFFNSRPTTELELSDHKNSLQPQFGNFQARHMILNRNWSLPSSLRGRYFQWFNHPQTLNHERLTTQ